MEMMIERLNGSVKTIKRLATIAALSSLILAAGFDWAAAATLAELGGAELGGNRFSGPGNAEMFVIVLFAAGFCLLAALVRHGRPKRASIRSRVSTRHRAGQLSGKGQRSEI
jgi:predicted oxidoreductase